MGALVGNPSTAVQDCSAGRCGRDGRIVRGGAPVRRVGEASLGGAEGLVFCVRVGVCV